MGKLRGCAFTIKKRGIDLAETQRLNSSTSQRLNLLVTRYAFLQA